MLGIIIGILACIAALAVPVIIIAAIVNAVKKNKEGEKKESFEDILRTIYLYILLIIFLCMIIVGIVGTVESAIDLCLPKEEFEEGIEGQNSINTLITDTATYIAVFGVSLPMFILHNKKVKEDKKENKE